MLRSLPALLLCGLVLALAAGCGEEPKTPTAVTSFCSDGTATCIGNLAATCTGGGTGYTLSPCGESGWCSNGVCNKPVVCPKGKLSCSSDGKDVLACPADGAADATKSKSCAASESCKSGICVAKACKDGDRACGWQTLLECVGGQWQETACGNNQVCDPATFTCVARTCSPTASLCKTDKVVQVCSLTGDKWNEQACPAGQGCYTYGTVDKPSGVCHPLIQGKAPDLADAGTTEDAGTGTDTVKTDAPGFLELPPKDVVLEELDLLKVVVSETATPPSGASPRSFDFATATWNDGLGMLQVSGVLGGEKLEIQIAKIEQYTTGSFTLIGLEAEETKVLYNDGTVDTGGDWQYEAIDYTISIDDWGDRVKGTFSAVLSTKAKQELHFVDGVFDIVAK